MPVRLLIAGFIQRSDGDSVECQLPETRPPTGISAQKSQDFVDVVVVAVETEDKAAGVQKSSLVCFDGDTWSVTLGCAVGLGVRVGLPETR